MIQQNNFPPIIVLSKTTEGAVQCMSVDGELVPLLGHGNDLVCIFVPVLLVEQQLAYKDYTLYLFDNENVAEVTNKINNLKQQEENAILLVGRSNDRTMYFIEDKELVSPIPTPVSCEYYFQMINKFITTVEGKVIGSADLDQVAMAIRFLRLEGNRGNEAGTTGTRVGNHVFSTNFLPCNAVVARQKKENQFIIYHAFDAGIDRVASKARVFLDAIKHGGGTNFTAVMQNAKNQVNRTKAPIIGVRLALELEDPNVSRINVPEGYGAIACVNKNTIIISSKMQFFRDAIEKNNFSSQFNLTDLDTVRILDLDKECISLRETAKTLVSEYQAHVNEKDWHLKQTYSQLIGKLGVFAFDDVAKLPESRNSCCSIM